jgi:Icc protein
MFETCQPKVNRRQLLKGGLALVAGVVTLGPSRVLGDDRPDAQPSYEADDTRWAFLSDTHVAADPENHYRGFYPYRNLQETAAQIASHLPDGLVITGDLARLKGQAEAYDNLKMLLAPVANQRPVYLGLGNHDDRDDFFRAFGDSTAGDRAVENKHIVTAEAGPVRLIVLDTLLAVNTITGRLGQSQRTWLETFLHTCDDKPAILFLHHTPNSELLDTRPLFEIIRPIAKVKAVVYGHSHKYEFAKLAGIHLVNLPATGFNFACSQPVGWVEARLTKQGGEFTLHAIGGNREIDGHVQKLSWRS